MLALACIPTNSVDLCQYIVDHDSQNVGRDPPVGHTPWVMKLVGFIFTEFKESEF